MEKEKLVSRLQKILALARKGVGGEKENAQRMLEKLLAKHGMTMADLEDEQAPTKTYWFAYSNVHEKKLIVQIVVSVTDNVEIEAWRNRSKRNEIGFDLTKADYLQIELAYDIHRKALRKKMKEQMALITRAYINANKIYPATEGEQEPKELTPAEIRDLQAIMAMSRAMDPTPVHAALESRA